MRAPGGSRARLDRLVELEHAVDATSSSPSRTGQRGDELPPLEPLLRRRASGPRAGDQATNRPSKRRRKRGWLVKLAVAFLITLIVLLVGAWGYTSWRIGQIERVDVAEALAPIDGATTWLIVGSDSRDGIDPDRPDAGGLLGEPVFGQRADTIILVRDIPGEGARTLSLPRDLWIDPPGENNATRINGAYNDGPAALIELISKELAIPVNRYAEVNLAGLDSVVDAIGGVTIEIEHPGFDDSIGLRIDEAGPVTLDGATALGYVRTRKWTEIVDGGELFDASGDLGRNQRQQRFLAALGSKLGATRNPATLNAALSGVADAVRVDEGAGIGDLYSLARLLQNAQPSEALPVVHHTTGGGAAVLLLSDGSEAILDRYR